MLGKKKVMALALVIASMLAVTGCGGKQAAGPAETLVKSMQVIKRDTPIVYEYSGFVQRSYLSGVLHNVSAPYAKHFQNKPPHKSKPAHQPK